MTENLLSEDDAPLYEYNRKLRGSLYPVFVLNYIGTNGHEIPIPEIVLGLNDVEQEVRVMKAKIIRQKVD